MSIIFMPSFLFFWMSNNLLKKLSKHKKDSQATPQKQDGLRGPTQTRAYNEANKGQATLKDYIRKTPRPN